MDINEIRERNIKELNSLEIKKKQLAEELKEILKSLDLAEMPTKEFIDEEIEKLQRSLQEKQAALDTLMQKYETLVKDQTK